MENQEQPVHIGWKYSSGIGKDKKFVINTNKGLMDFDQYAVERGLTASCLDKRYRKYGGDSEHPEILSPKFCTGNRKHTKKRTNKKTDQPPTFAPLPVTALAAISAMQGLLANPTVGDMDYATIANSAWDYAEALSREGRSRGLISRVEEE